jgi:thiol-disulfide isomerase/thioredoxin
MPKQMIARMTAPNLETQEGSMNGQSKPKPEAISGAFRFRSRHLLLSALGIGLVTLLGCGRSESPGSAVVPPPAPAGSERGSLSDTHLPNSEPPGGLELPEGSIPTPTEQDAPKSKGFEMPADADVPATPPSDLGAQSKVKYGTWEEIQAVAKTSGRITVIDLWSLACEPCLKEFPGLVHLNKTLGSSVQCIAVNMDFDGRKSRPPEYYEPQVIAFLDSVGASDLPTYISRTPSDDVYAATKLASIPAVLIYNADGEVEKVFVDAGDTVGFTYEQDVIPLVKELAG